MTSLPLILAEEMGHKGVRAMTPLDANLANELRTKLGKGRELPEEPVKLKRVAKPKAPAEDGAVVDGAEVVAKKPSRAKKAKPAESKASSSTKKAKPAAAAKPKASSNSKKAKPKAKKRTSSRKRAA